MFRTMIPMNILKYIKNTTMKLNLMNKLKNLLNQKYILIKINQII